MGFLCANCLHVVRLQRWEAIEFHGAVAGGVRTGRQPVQTVTNRQVQWEAVLVVLVHDVGAVAGRAGDDHFFHLAFLLGPDRKLDGFVHGFDQAGEFAHVGVYPTLDGGAGFTRNQYHFTDQDAGVGDQRTARLQDDFRQVVAEIFLEEADDFFGVGFQAVGAGDVVGREATAHVDQLEVDAVFFLQAFEDHFDLGNRRVPHADVALLRANVEGDAVWHQAQVTGEDQQVHGHVGLAAEFARQRPVSSGRAFGEDAHVDFRTRRGLGDVAQVGFGVGGIQTHALLVEVANVLGFLDGVAVADAIRADALVHDFVELVDRRDVEVRAFLFEQVDDFDGRVGLDRVVDLGEFETGTQVVIGLADHRGVDHHERGFLFVGKRLHFVEGFTREIVFDVDRHAGNSYWQTRLINGCK